MKMLKNEIKSLDKIARKKQIERDKKETYVIEGAMILEIKTKTAALEEFKIERINEIM